MTAALTMSWVDEAARMPVAFAQVREDALIDLAVLDRIGRDNLSCFLIASGGCTAAALAASGRVSQLHLVDANPAQLALCRLKLNLLHTAEPQERLRILGHQVMDPQDRAAALEERLTECDLSPEVLAPLKIIAERGPDHAGRYELVFAELRRHMRDVDGELAEALTLPDPFDRAGAFGGAARLGRRMDAAFDSAMALPHLQRLFSPQATQNALVPFARHFASRTRRAIIGLPAASNPYLWQMLLGRFPDGVVYPWLAAQSPAQMPKITESVSTADAALATFKDRLDFVHLSNILDWLSADEARRTLSLAGQALRPGGYVLIRQLNSSLDLRGVGDQFEWLEDESDRLHAEDRSFFYRQLHLGRRR